MKAYLYFFEDYIDFIFAVAKELKLRNSNLELIGLAARRSTVRSKIDKANLPIKHYDWIGDLEREWLSVPLDRDKLKKYEKLIGTHNIRHLITCDRELGSGFMTGGIYASTKLRKLTNHNDEMRWRYIVGVLDYYHHTFSSEKPDFVFFNEFTMAYELAAYFIAQSLGIPCFCFSFSRFGDVFLLDDNPYNFFTSAAKLFKASQKDESLIQKQYIDHAVKYLQEFKRSPDVPSYSNIFKKRAKEKASFLNLLGTIGLDIARIAAISAGLYGTQGFLRQRSGLDILKNNLNVFLETKKLLMGIGFEEPKEYLECDYLYYPLHVDPEASTMVLADKITNQLFVIENMAKSMPAGYKLLVKEHLPMIGMRPKGFYEAIRNMPDVHLITPFADGFSLIRNSKLVLTITGTAAFEAILLSKPAIVMGHTQFNCLGQGLIHTTELAALEEIIYKSINLKPAVEKDLILFIAATLQEGVHIPIEVFASSHYGKGGKTRLPEYQKEIQKIVDKLLNNNLKKLWEDNAE